MDDKLQTDQVKTNEATEGKVKTQPKWLKDTIIVNGHPLIVLFPEEDEETS